MARKKKSNPIRQYTITVYFREQRRWVEDFLLSRGFRTESVMVYSGDSKDYVFVISWHSQRQEDLEVLVDWLVAEMHKYVDAKRPFISP